MKLPTNFPSPAQPEDILKKYLLDAAPNAMWAVDASYCLAACNHQFREAMRSLTGYSPVIGQSLLEWGLPDELTPKYFLWYDRALSGETLSVDEYLPANNQEWLEVKLSPILTDNKVTGVACIALQTAGSKENVAKLKEANQKLLLQEQFSPLAYIEWDAELNLVKWSKRAGEIFGWSEAEIRAVGLSGLDLVHESDRLTIVQMLKDLFSGKRKSATMQSRNYNKDGKVLWCQWYYSVQTDVSGTPMAILSQVMDITAQKRLEDSMMHANRLYSFSSKVNQLIVQSRDEDALYNGICHIAVHTGEFEVAWVGEIDRKSKSMRLVAQSGIYPSDCYLFDETKYEYGGLAGKVMRTGHYAVSTNIDEDPVMLRWQPLARQRGWRSCISLPIRRGGIIVGMLNLIAKETDFFNSDEIALLCDAANDISFALDVFEKEQARHIYEDKLKHSEYRLKQAQAIAHLGSWYLDYATGIATWSEEACAIYGLDEQDNTQSYMSWMSFIHPDDVAIVSNAINDTLAILGKVEFHHRIIRTDGEIRHLFTQTEIETSPDGRPISIHGVSYDVTEKLRTQEALARSEANLRMIMDLIPQSIYARDENGKVLFANRSFARLMDSDPDSVLGMDMSEVFPIQPIEVVGTGTLDNAVENTLTDAEGDERCFKVTKLPYEEAVTGRKAILGIAMEVTEQKRLEAERQKMVADIIQRVKDLEQFSYIVSHNLRAPVANIMGLADVLQMPSLAREEKESLNLELVACAKKLDDVIFDLNYILQIRDKERMHRETVDFAGLLADICEHIGKQMDEEHVVVVSDFDEVSEMHTVKSFMHSIFYNLVSNSVKYRRPDVVPQIWVSSERTANGLALTFSDNGLGIDLERRGQYMFGLYKRFHGHVEGKGMGLFMVKTQVELLGGHIGVQSQVNEGTTFRIEFDLIH